MKKKRAPRKKWLSPSMNPRKLFDVELLDTRPSPSRTILKVTRSGTHQMQAVRKAAKILPPSINLQEWRDPREKKYSRYVFLTGELK